MQGRSSYRWLVLASYMLVVAVSQMLWLNFAPITKDIMYHYHVSEFQAGMLTIVFPLFYVLFSIPSGVLIDRFGYKNIVNIGAFVMAIAALMRIWSPQFWVLMAGQLLIAAAQPFVVNSITKCVADWFDHSEAALATGLGTVGIFAGMIISLGLSPYLATTYNIHYMLLIFTGIAFVAALLFALFAKERTRSKRVSGIKSEFKNIKALCKNSQLILLFVLAFLAMGVFNALMTWLQPILAANGVAEDQVGVIGAVLIGAGVLGAIVFPAMSDKLKRRRPFLLFSCCATVVLFLPFVFSHQYSFVLIFASLLGFLFLPGYALLLTMTEEVAGQEHAGSATGILMLAGNAGAVLFSLLSEYLSSASHLWCTADMALFIVLLIALGLMVWQLKESYNV